MAEQTSLTCETEPSDPPAERRRSASPPTDSSARVLALIERLAADSRADVAKLDRMMALYERLRAKDAELAYNAAKGRILKKLPASRSSRTARHSTKSTVGNHKRAPTKPSNTRRWRRSTNICARSWRKRRWTSPIPMNHWRVAAS